MKRLAIVTILAALAWSAYWLWSAQALHGALTGWIEDRRSEGWTAEYSDLSVRGFPNRVDVTLSDLVLEDPEAGLRWEAPFFQILQLVYKPGHKILVWPNTQTVTLDGRDYRIASQGLRASTIFGPEDRLLRANLEASVLNVDGPRGDLALAGVLAGIQEVATRRNAYRVGITADAAAGTGDSGDTLDGLRLQAEIAFDAPWRRAALSEPRPQPERIAIRLIEYRRGALFLRMAGTLEVDPAGRPEGDLTLRAENWRALLDHAVETGQMPQALAQTLEGGLGLLAQLAGNGDILELPLRFEDGGVRLGPLPLGDAPRLRLP